MTSFKKPVGIFLPAMRISFALAMLTACLLLGAELLGFTPDEARILLGARKQVSEALAIQFSIFAPGQEPNEIQKTLANVVKRNPEIESAGIRLLNGQLIFQVGDHVNKWVSYVKDKSTPNYLVVPLFKNNDPWGDIEIKYTPLQGETYFDFYKQSIFKLGGFVLLIGFFVNLAFMLRTLRVLDPTAVVPDRVNAAFDTLTEGVLILDEHEQIVLANRSMTEKLVRPLASLLGKKLSTLQWDGAKNENAESHYPWQRVLSTGKSSIGAHLTLISSDYHTYKFIINASPILSANGVTQGVLITLADITELEERNIALQMTVSRLEEAQSQVEQQNKELNFLATKDPLTGCLNRRSFNEQFEVAFKKAQQNKSELSCFMADIDHFKAVNDTYGHATGDVVIKLFAEVLQANTRKVDVVGRYGGEEFCIVVPDLPAEEVVLVAERIRLRLKDESEHRFDTGPHVTASFGVASLKDNPLSPTELQNFADEALYVAKQSGRNRVVRWEPGAEKVGHAETQTSLVQEYEERKVEGTPETASITKLQQRVNELENIASQFSAELEYAKNYDAVTGLPNQVLFYDRIGQIIERGNRYNQLAAVVVIDIGMFSQINTALGRSAGDKLLTEVAERLKTVLRKYDAVSRLNISRLGGDEFAVLLTDLATKEAVTWIVNRLQDALLETVDIDGNSVYLSSHMGISLYPSDSNSVDDLINNAMIAKKYSKQFHTESHYQFFDEHMQKLSAKHVNLDKELRDSILFENWALLYQPKIDIKSKAIVGVEALIRWKHPTRGLLSPHEFIEFAEQRGLIVPIGDWVIKTACMQIQEWMSLGLDCKVAVNVSAMQLKQEDFVGNVFRILTASGVPPRQLELEVTESTLMNNFDIALQSLKRLNNRGIEIAIDDFGTGYSSLSYLKNLPINILKIDRTFIKDICNNENDKKIVNALVQMAHSLGMTVVAEGVEEHDQLNILAQNACDQIQGYLLSEPIPAEQMTKMLTSPDPFKFEVGK